MQRKAAFRPILLKTPCCVCEKMGFERSASAFLVRLFAFAAVRERSWLVCGGFGLLRRGEIRLLRRKDHVIGAVQGQECV